MVNKIDCICNVMEVIDGFKSIWEFERFQKYIEQLLKDGYIIETPVEQKYAGFNEQWYKCKDCEQMWRLVHPDFPFKGLWDIVNKY